MAHGLGLVETNVAAALCPSPDSARLSARRRLSGLRRAGPLGVVVLMLNRSLPKSLRQFL
jgi:hypothetical protein